MSIGIYVANFPPVICGVGDNAFRLAEQLRDRHHLDVVVYSGATVVDQGLIQREVHIDSQRSIREFAHILQKDGITTLIIEYQAHSFNRTLYPNLLVLYLRLCTAIKTILVMHDFAGPVITRFINSRVMGRVINIVTFVFAHAVVVTDKQRFTQLAQYRLIRGLRLNLHYIPPGSNIELVGGLPPVTERRDICFFGLVNRSKQIETLIDAFAELAHSAAYADRCLYIIGEGADSEYGDRLKEYAGSMGQELRIRFTGRCTSAEVSRYLQQMRVCVLPYIHGLRSSGVAATCVQHRLPVIGTVVDRSENIPGVWPLRLPLEKAQLRTAIDTLLTDEAAHKRLVAELDEAQVSSSWETISDKFMSLCYAGNRGIVRAENKVDSGFK